MAEQLRPRLWTAIMAVTKRQWLTYVRYPSWFISMMIWPLLFPFGYIFSSKALAGPDGAALATFGRLAGTTDFAGFIAIGTTFWMWFNVMLWNLGGALRAEQMRGTLESNWLAPVPKAFLLLGSFLTEAAMGLIMVGCSALTIYLVWGVRLLGSFWHLAVIILASIPSIYGIGMVFASIVLAAKEINALIFFVRGLMTVFCGVTYPITVLPSWMKGIS
ncbi:MAG: ABC transporter permease, partial [Bacillota bacterium]